MKMQPLEYHGEVFKEVTVLREDLDRDVAPLLAQGWRIVHTSWRGRRHTEDPVIYTFLLVKGA